MAIGDVERLRGLLSLPDAPLINTNLVEILTFFRTALVADPFGWTDYLRGIDFHRPVSSTPLSPRTLISRHSGNYVGRPKPFVYFTKPGTSPYSTGTSFPESVFELFETIVTTPALQSYAAPIQYDLKHPEFPFQIVQRRADVSRMGGGIQYIVSIQSLQSLRRVR